jgi:Raf kinase inhibitor-like YbhB/YbcL family protein
MLENIPEQLGRSLQRQRAGIEKTALQRLLRQREVPHIELRSVAFEHLMPLPTRFTADGDGDSPPLMWFGIPANAESVVLIVEDADSPTPRPMVHAIAVNLAPVSGSLAEGALSRGGDSADEVDTGLNSFLRHGWLPPDPPPGHGEHRYVFQLFALTPGPAFSRLPGRQALFDAIADRAVAAGYLIGTYERPQRQLVDRQRQERLSAEQPIELDSSSGPEIA